MCLCLLFIIIIVSYHAFYVLLSCVASCGFVLSLACVCFRVLDSFSVVTGPRAEIDGYDIFRVH